MRIIDEIIKEIIDCDNNFIYPRGGIKIVTINYLSSNVMKILIKLFMHIFYRFY